MEKSIIFNWHYYHTTISSFPKLVKNRAELNETELNIKGIYFWTDSGTVLKYIRNENKRFPAYIKHQISKIRTNSDIKDRHFISGALNVSDHCTRPLKFEDCAKPNSFLSGPKFFFEPLRNVFSKDDTVLEENEFVHYSLGITSDPVIVQKTVIPWDRYPSWQNLVRYIAYIKLIIRNWKIKKNNTKKKAFH